MRTKVLLKMLFSRTKVDIGLTMLLSNSSLLIATKNTNLQTSLTTDDNKNFFAKNMEYYALYKKQQRKPLL